MKLSVETLFSKYLAGQCSPEETMELMSYFKLARYETDLKQAILSELKQELLKNQNAEDVTQRLTHIKGQLQSHIQQAKTSAPKPIMKLWLPVSAAAAMFLIVSSVLWYYLRTDNDQGREIHYAGDALPGRSGATLTLANGRKIQLRDAGQGELVKESGISISKTADGQLAYEITGDPKVSGTNTLSTARGETYQVKLPDGSRVWLNAASSLTYQTSLTDHGQRKIKLNGEAYFEVQKDAGHPFVVESKDQEVEVLGTHFNVKAYEEDGNSRTTLLEGLVRLKSSNRQNQTKSSVVLAPGEQAINNGLVAIENADLEEAVAWKNGNTVFKDRSLEDIMLELARWYDIKVVYAADAPKNEPFSGAVSKSRKLSAVLGRMQNTGSVRFSIAGKTVTVMK